MCLMCLMCLMCIKLIWNYLSSFIEYNIHTNTQHTHIYKWNSQVSMNYFRMGSGPGQDDKPFLTEPGV